MTFPTIPTSGAGRILKTNQANTSSTRTFPNLSSLTKNAGDLLIAIVWAYQSGGTSGSVFSAWGGGFTEFKDQGNSPGVGLAYKWSTGSETGTFTVTEATAVTGHASMMVMSIPGAHATTPPEAGGFAVGGALSTATPGSLTPSWGAEDTLWIAAAASGDTFGVGFTGLTTTPPTNYTNQFNDTGGQTAAVTGAVDSAVAFRQLNATSEDPGNFGNDQNGKWGAITIAVRPANVSTGTASLSLSGTARYMKSVPVVEAGAEFNTFGIQPYNRDFETDISSWESNPSFGSYDSATLSWDTTHVHSGTHALKVTAPTPTVGHRWANAYGIDLPAVGDFARLRFWVYIPTGVPDPTIDIAFQFRSPTLTSVKDAWVQIECVYWAGSQVGMFAGVHVAGATAGQSYWIDDVSFEIVDAPFAIDLARAYRATGSLSLSASATQSSTATGSLTLTANQVGANVTATASLSLSGTATHRNSATGSLSLSASATQSSPATAALTLSGSATHTESATASITLSGSATHGSNSATAALTLSGAATNYSTATGSLTLSAAGTQSSLATGSLTLSASGTQSSPATGSLTLSGTATSRANATATASLTLSATETTSNSATGSLALSASATQSSPATGTLTLSASGTQSTRATATLDLLGQTRPAGAPASGTGSLELIATWNSPIATATGSLDLSAAATHANNGTASFALSASATQASNGATGSLSLSATGKQSTPASGYLDLSAAATQSSPATGSLSLSGTATNRSTATGSLSLSASAAEFRTATASLTLSGTAKHSSPASASLALSGTAKHSNTATASLVLTGTWGSTRATALGSLTLSASATSRAAATATGSLALSGTATTTNIRATAIGSLTLSASARPSNVRATATASLTLSGTATANRRRISVVVSQVSTYDQAIKFRGSGHVVNYNDTIIDYSANTHWRFYAQRVMTDVWLDRDVRLTEVSIEWALSGPGSLVATVDSSLAVALAIDGTQLFDEWSTIVYAEANGEIRWGGILVRSEAGDNGIRKLEFAGFTAYPHGRIFDGNYQAYNIDAFDIVRYLWDRAQDDPYGHLGMVVDTNMSGQMIGGQDPGPRPVREAGESKDDYKARVDEWQSSGEDAGYKLDWWDNPDIGEEIDSVMQQAPGDYEEIHSWVDKTKEAVNHRLKLASPLIGRRRLDLRFVEGENIMVPPAPIRDGDNYANHIIALGAGSGRDILRIATGGADGRLRRDKVIQEKSVKGLERLRKIAKAQYDVSKDMVNLSEVVVFNHPNARIGSWQLGDEVLIEANSSFQEIRDWYRIVSWTVNVNDSDFATLQLTKSAPL